MSKKYFFVKVRNDHGTTYRWTDPHLGGSCSYEDYWRLIDLWGMPTCELAEADITASDTTYICAPWNGYTAAHFNRPHKCRVVHWDIERPGLETQPGVDEVWVSDKTQRVMHKGSNVRYLILGGHPNLGGEPLHPKMFDMATLAYHDGRRAGKFGALASKGITLSGNAYGAERDHILARSSAGLMLFQDDYAIMTPLRAILYASWKLPIVSENVGESFPYRFIPFDENLTNLAAMSKSAVQETVEHNSWAAAAFPFWKQVEEAL